MHADTMLTRLQPIVSRDNFRYLQSAMNDHYRAHGNDVAWDTTLSEIPCLTNTHADFSSDTVKVTADSKIDHEGLKNSLKNFMPWRKGPFDLCGIHIDSEWRSDWKWHRLIDHIAPLTNRRVLDIGCGNGYYLFRMLGADADIAVGVDPTRLFLYQFMALQKLLPNNNAFYLPLRSEHLPAFASFDTVFSMGVLYHHRSPFEHLSELNSFLKPGGELVLETLIVPGDLSTALVPADRYARMANVWYLPSVGALEIWLQRIGFCNVRIVDVCKTTTNEQRQTEWMQFQSLADFLDPGDPKLTIEGYPAPHRAILIANKPD
jgi:tRNA (mo5U34)-methyltransferase